MEDSPAAGVHSSWMPSAVVNLPLAIDRCYARSTMHATAEHARDALYLYIDEAGNFDFGHTGTRHFVLTGVLMRRPFTHLAASWMSSTTFLKKVSTSSTSTPPKIAGGPRSRVSLSRGARSGVRMLCVVARKAGLNAGFVLRAALRDSLRPTRSGSADCAHAHAHARGADHRRHRFSPCGAVELRCARR